MKSILLLLAILIILISPAIAQGNGKEKGKAKADVSEKSKGAKDKDKDKEKADKQIHETGIWEGTKDNDGGGPKPSKNQPAKVRAAFISDYPYAANISWSKYRGDWTATFRNGPFWSTAVYHANGDRRDTRTHILKEQVPFKILDIFKKKPGTRLDAAIKIEIPKAVKDIFRIKANVDGAVKYLFYNGDGQEVQYNY